MEGNSVMQHQSKIQQLLQKFLETDFQIKNHTYLNRLLTHFSGQDKTELDTSLMNNPIFSEWLVQALALWETNNTAPAANISSFTLNLAALLSKNENTFCRLNTDNFFLRLVHVLKATQPEAAPTVKLGYIKLLESFLAHKPGIDWIISRNLWEDVLKFSLTNQTVYITKHGHNFMAKILEKLIDHNETICHDIIKRIMLPLEKNTYKSIKDATTDIMEVSDEIMYQNLNSTLQLIGHILDHFLENVLFARNDCRIVSIFLRDFHLEQKICNFMMIAQNRYFIFDLGKIMFVMQFLELYSGVISDNLKEANVKICIRKMMSIFSTNISKGNFENVLKFCYYGQCYWNLMGYKIPCVKVSKDNEPMSFANQLLVIQLLPIFAIAMKCRGKCPAEYSDEFRDQYIQKLFTMMCETTVRIAYCWRDYLTAQPNLFDISTKGLNYIMNSRKFYPRERAALAFQSFVYAMKDVTCDIKLFPEKVSVYAREVNFFSLLFDALVVFIEEFQITWRDSVETICVMAISFDFLTVPTWPSQLVIKALKLVNTSITKYMSPNLALLVDRTNDSTMAVLGPLLLTKLHDTAWEVRDSALEVVCTISHMSNTKFPSLQKVLMDSELPTLVVKMSTCDGESFVRATAIKCLQEMIQVEEIWNNALKSENLTQKMREILLNETEGIVRVEAATFMCIAYEQQQFPKECLDSIYETMIHSSTTDLHWEVKVRALAFWDKVIKNHLQNQGMIDGSFPNVTFSKEHRKIVTLTDSEIRKRLQKVLTQLSGIGCLGVLMSAIKDDCDMEVSKTAVKITQRLVELFKKYNVYGDGSAPTSPVPTENGAYSVPSVSSGISMEDMTTTDSPAVSYQPDFNDEIIDQIVNSKDVCLLKNVYSPSDYGSVTNYDIQVRKIVTPNEFLQYTQQDLNNIIAEKKNWLNGIEDLGSLLDDMLKTYDEEVNNMDCY